MIYAPKPPPVSVLFRNIWEPTCLFTLVMQLIGCHVWVIYSGEEIKSIGRCISQYRWLNGTVFIAGTGTRHHTNRQVEEGKNRNSWSGRMKSCNSETFLSVWQHTILAVFQSHNVHLFVYLNAVHFNAVHFLTSNYQMSIKTYERFRSTWGSWNLCIWTIWANESEAENHHLSNTSPNCLWCSLPRLQTLSQAGT